MNAPYVGAFNYMVIPSVAPVLRQSKDLNAFHFSAVLHIFNRGSRASVFFLIVYRLWR